MFFRLTTVLALVAAAVAIPTAGGATTKALQARGFDCSNPVAGLRQDDCNYLSEIKFVGYGRNPTSNNGNNVWIGSNGPNVFTFKNTARTDVTLCIWDQKHLQFVTAHAPVITYSLPVGQSVKISMNHGISGGYSAVYRYETKMGPWGQIDNTLGEFTTGDHATINISRLVNMKGNIFEARVSTGCVTNMNKCVFVCKDRNAKICGESHTYDLVDCPSNHGWTSDGNPTGGCQGWSWGSATIAADIA